MESLPQRWTRRRLTAVASTALAVLILSGMTAAASRAFVVATPGQGRAIALVLGHSWQKLRHAPCPKGGSVPGMPFVRKAYVSGTDPRYAFAWVADRHCLHSIGYFMKRRSPRHGRWKIAYQVSDSAQQCSEFGGGVPHPVLEEFHLESSGGACWLGTPFDAG